MEIGRLIRLKSERKKDYLHRPDTVMGRPGSATTWPVGIGNEWIVEKSGDKIKLRSWKNDYLHRSDSVQDIVTWDQGIGNEWIVEEIDNSNIKLRSWKNDYLYRPDSPQGIIGSPAQDSGSKWTVEEIAVILPDYKTLADGPHQARLLPGQAGVVFSMYVVPDEYEKFVALINFMKDPAHMLGNGFDPGPQLKPENKRCFEKLAREGWPVICYPVPLNPENERVLEVMDQSGVFSAVQFGEWGYHFHNNPPPPPPERVKGFWREPKNKQEAYDMLKEYFTNASRQHLGRVNSVTGHSHYEAYAGEWGARSIGLEVGENIGFTQSKLAFARGASKAWQKPWSVQVSPWFHGACTSADKLHEGHSFSFYKRMWLHAWFAGAAMVTPENSINNFFMPRTMWELSDLGREACSVFSFMQNHDRGVPYTPVAVVIDHLAGYNGYNEFPWAIEKLHTAGDQELHDLFDRQLFPDGDRPVADMRPPKSLPGKDASERFYLVPTPCGEIFDVLLTNVPPEILPTYPVILLAGEIAFDNHIFLGELEKALRRGCRVLMSQHHHDTLKKLKTMGENECEFERISRHGQVEVLDTWINPATGRPTAISNDRLAWLRWELLPIIVEGDPVQYQINRNHKGWVVELINNLGVEKHPYTDVKLDPTAVARIVLRPLLGFSSFNVWRSSPIEPQPDPAVIVVKIAPGETEFVEFVSQA